MPTDLPFECLCGNVRAVARGVEPSVVNHIVCYCDDCQAYARWLAIEGVMNDAGGTAIAQMSPARLTFQQGEEHLGLVQLGPKGLHRWYTTCCRTPVGNTTGKGPPFLGLILTGARPEGEFDDLLGAEVGVNARFASGPTQGAFDRPPVRFLVRFIRLMLGWWVRGDNRRKPWPADAPRTVLTAEERTALN